MLFLFSLSYVCNAQVDSTTIKLEQYKEMFTKGLITAKDYDKMKDKLLRGENIKTVAKPRKTPWDSVFMTTVRKKGYCSINEIGALFGIAANVPVYTQYVNDQGNIVSNNITGRSTGIYKEKFFAFKTSHGGLLKHGIYLGASFEFDFHRNSQESLDTFGSSRTKEYSRYHLTEIMVPVALELRVPFIQRKVTPFYNQRLGYSAYFALPSRLMNGAFVGGAMAESMLGIKGYIGKRIGLQGSIGYRMQHLFSSKEVTNSYFHYISLMLGATF